MAQKKVFTPELIDKAIISSKKVVDPVTGVISFLSPETNGVIWSTNPSEKDFLVLQLGSADPELAVKAFRKVKEYVSEVNLNSGCPKRFSIQAGMGAALLKTPELLVSILKRLGEECNILVSPDAQPIPLSVKLRLITNDESDTSSHIYQCNQKTVGGSSGIDLKNDADSDIPSLGLGIEAYTAVKEDLNNNTRSPSFGSYSCREKINCDELNACISEISTNQSPTFIDSIPSTREKAGGSDNDDSYDVLVDELAFHSSQFYNMLFERCPNLDHIIVHSRRVPDRSEKVPAFWDVWMHLLKKTKVPLIANGDFLQPEAISTFWNTHKKFPMLKGLMIARGAQSNPSIFLPFSKHPSEMLAVINVCKIFLSLAKDLTPSSFTHIKFSILQMLPKPIEKHKAGSIVLHATSWQVLLSAFE